MKTIDAGYVFNFQGHGAFSPEGRVDIAKDDIEAHNAAVAETEWANLVESGRGILYWDGRNVSNWTGSISLPADRVSSSWHNMAGKDGRTDVWFRINGVRWHGVNIGDNQILRVKRVK